MGALVGSDEADPVALIQAITNVPDLEAVVPAETPPQPPPSGAASGSAGSPDAPLGAAPETMSAAAGPGEGGEPASASVTEATSPEPAAAAPGRGSPLAPAAEPGAEALHQTGDGDPAEARSSEPVPDGTPAQGDAELVAASVTASPSPAGGPEAGATRVFKVVRDDREGVLGIRIPTDGRPSCRVFFTEGQPVRLVLDFEGTESRPLFQRLDVGVGPVRRVRVGQHAAEPVPVVRVVFDLDERVAHRIETGADGLTVRFDDLALGAGAAHDERDDETSLSNTGSLGRAARRGMHLGSGAATAGA
jgi:hypothetical protein